MNKRLSLKALFFGTAVVSLVCIQVDSAEARVKGVCSDCHTMHNSQDGAHMILTPAVDGTSALRALTRGSCVGCHTGTNNGSNNIPYVDDRGAVPTYTSADGTSGNTLAGGSFYWVRTSSDTMGHNVEDIDSADGTLANTPPGFDAATNGSVYATGSRLTCAGTNGCHGNQSDADSYGDLAGAHHGDDSTIDGTTLAKSFRFLLGVEGKEDSDWEYQPTASAHNQYKGEHRSADTGRSTNATSGGPSTISGLCGNCHGDFHANTAGEISTVADPMSNPWMRHPTDFDMANAAGTTEYAAYNVSASGGGTATAANYSVQAPVASSVVSSVLSTVDVQTDDAGEAIVTCISCHRAHGSPYADLLRWDYSEMVAHRNTSSEQNTNNGCFVCHTTKDDV